MFSWFRNRRRRKLLAVEPTAEQRYWISETLWQFDHLPPDRQRQLLDIVRVMVSEIRWEGCQGLAVTNEMRYAIAAQAAMLLLGFVDEYFDWLQTVLIYPDAFVVDGHLFNAGSNLTVVGSQAREGQTSRGGPVIVNWSAIADQVLDSTGGQNPSAWSRNDFGRNLVVHEFSHQLDMVGDGVADGVPPLGTHIDARQWERDFRDAFQMEREAAHEKYSFRIDGYGLTSLTEYFAVTSESYFTTPHELAEHYTATYDLLLDFYKVDWREYLPRFG